MATSWVLLIMIQGVASAWFRRTVLSLSNVSAVGSMSDVFGMVTL